MAYTDDEQTRRPNVTGSHTATATSDSTFGRQAVLTVGGSFTADVVLQAKTYGDASTAGFWVEVGRVTGPGEYRYRTNMAKPVRYVVENYIDGTVQVQLDLPTPSVDEFQLD